MERSKEFDDFNSAMDAILRADPKAVKESMDAEHKANAKMREEKGQRKRGRPLKPTSTIIQKGRIK
jgi:uncharacterized membrane protein YukC